MPVNAAYPEFFAAIEAIEGGADPWPAYEGHYLEPHRQVLEAYWRQCWGVGPERLRQIVAGVRPADYRALRDSLRGTDIEALARQALAKCASLVPLPEPQVDLLVGRFSPDAFLFEVGGRWHIGVGLERFGDFSHLPLFISHEYGHYARRLLAPEPTNLGDRLVGEGIAIAFAEAAYPDQPLTRYLRMSPRRVHEIRELEPRLWAALAPHLDAPDNDEFAGVLSGARRWRDFPPRFGSYLGYAAVRCLALAQGVSPASRPVITAPSAIILEPYLGPLRIRRR